MLRVTSLAVVCLTLVFGYPEKRSVQLDPNQAPFDVPGETSGEKRNAPQNVLSSHAEKRGDDDKKVEEIIHKLQEEYEEQQRNQKRSDKISDNIKLGKRGKNRRRSLVPTITTLDEAKEMSIVGVTVPSRTSPTDRKTALERHQHYRKQELAGNIWHLQYDDSLANLAQGLVDTCVFKHTNLAFKNQTDVGQNLAVMTGGDLTIERALELFHEERKHFDLATMSYKSFNDVGHYLQLINWETTHVGCAFKKCPTLFLPDSGRVWKDASYWACDYYPPLLAKKPPFEKGQKCERCQVPMGSSIGWKCVDDGCESCKKGSEGCNDPLECDISECEKDIDSNYCRIMSSMGYCNYDFAMQHGRYFMMKKYCATTCRICKDIPDAVVKQ